MKIPTVKELNRLWTVDPGNALALTEALIEYYEGELEIRAWRLKRLAEQMRALKEVIA